jgi:hypothetical protein
MFAIFAIFLKYVFKIDLTLERAEELTSEILSKITKPEKYCNLLSRRRSELGTEKFGSAMTRTGR